MDTYAKLASSIVTSSIWCEDNPTRILWIAILALKDKDGIVIASIPGLANIARITVDECEVGLVKLTAPDKYSKNQDEEGRRLIPIEGGWFVVNHWRYRDMLCGDPKNRERQRRFAEKKKKEALANVIPVCVSVSDNSLSKGDARGDFERVWERYPDKSGKAKAREAWIKAKVSVDETIAGIDRYVAYVEARRKGGFADLKYQNGSTWFRSQGWESEWTPDTSGVRAKGRPELDPLPQDYEMDKNSKEYKALIDGLTYKPPKEEGQG